MNKENYSKYYIQGSDHYLLPKDIFNELFQEMVNWREEAQYLRKILHKININGIEEENTSVLDLINENKELKEQQKEFINFLESMWEETQDIWYIKILSKYKEIIGENNE